MTRISRATTNTIKGPGANFKQVDRILAYGGDGITCWINPFLPAFPQAGIYTHKTKIAGAGSIKSKTLATSE